MEQRLYKFNLEIETTEKDLKEFLEEAVIFYYPEMPFFKISKIEEVD